MSDQTYGGRQVGDPSAPSSAGGDDRTPFLRRGPVFDLVVVAEAGIEPGGAVADGEDASTAGRAGASQRIAFRPALAQIPARNRRASRRPAPRRCPAPLSRRGAGCRCQNDLQAAGADRRTPYDPRVRADVTPLARAGRRPRPRRAQGAAQRNVVGDEDGDLAAELAGRRRHLGADEPAADDRHGRPVSTALCRSARSAIASSMVRSRCTPGSPTPGRSQTARRLLLRSTTASASTPWRRRTARLRPARPDSAAERCAHTQMPGGVEVLPSALQGQFDLGVGGRGTPWTAAAGRRGGGSRCR